MTDEAPKYEDQSDEAVDFIAWRSELSPIKADLRALAFATGLALRHDREAKRLLRAFQQPGKYADLLTANLDSPNPSALADAKEAADEVITAILAIADNTK